MAHVLEHPNLPIHQIKMLQYFPTTWKNYLCNILHVKTYAGFIIELYTMYYWCQEGRNLKFTSYYTLTISYQFCFAIAGVSSE